MEDIKVKNILKEKNKGRLRNAFLKGMSDVLVFGKKPQTKKFYNYSDALNHDISFLRKDLIEALIKVIKELPPEKKNELKNKLLEIEVEKDWDKITFEFEDNCKKIG
jgi:hypothetical protein